MSLLVLYVEANDDKAQAGARKIESLYSNIKFLIADHCSEAVRFMREEAPVGLIIANHSVEGWVDLYDLARMEASAAPFFMISKPASKGAIQKEVVKAGLPALGKDRIFSNSEKVLPLVLRYAIKNCRLLQAPGTSRSFLFQPQFIS